MRHRFEYLAVQVVVAAIRRLPWPVVRASGTVLGMAFYLLDRPHRRLAISNLHRAFPVRRPVECRAMARATFAHFGRLLTELLKFSTLTPEAMLRRIEFEGADRIRHAHAQGRGALLFTGHFGYWEVHGIVHALTLYPIALMARPLDNPYLNRFLEQVRTCTGNTLIYRRGSIRRVFRALAANQGVAILIDQHIQPADAVYVEFFNRPAATTSALAALALRTGAPVFPVFALPLGPGRYKMIYEHAVNPPQADDPDAVREFTQRCTDVLEMYVRRYPELWLWMHRRWRDVDTADDTVGGMFPAATSDEARE